MKKIIFIRHGKAKRNSESGRDFDRKLSNKGRIQSHVIGHLILEKEIKPGAIFSSDAARTTETIQIINHIISGNNLPINWNPDLYLCDLNTLLKFCFNLDNTNDTILICGHNFGISDCLNYFTELDLELSTCGTACVSFDTSDWNEISKGMGILDWIKLPRKILE